MKPKYRQFLRTTSTEKRAGIRTVILAAIAFALSLGGLVRVSAMPAEARISETWFAYSHEFRIDFRARVTKGSVYSSDLVAPEELLRVRAPGEPPTYRRVLVSQLTDSVRLDMPYKFRADRDAEIKATYRVDGMLTAPNLWTRPYPLVPQKEISVTGTELTISDLVVEVPVRQLLADTVKLIDELRLSHDQIEVKIRPVIDITVNGQPEPVAANVSPEFTVLLKNPATVEVDEPKVVSDSKSFTTTKVLERTVNLLGFVVPLTMVRQVALVGLSILAVALAGTLVLQWLQRRTKSADDLQRLGSSLIAASHFSVPTDAAVVDVPNAAQMIALHMRTDRPVVQTDDACYLVDGNTCYRLERKAKQ